MRAKLPFPEHARSNSGIRSEQEPAALRLVSSLPGRVPDSSPAGQTAERVAGNNAASRERRRSNDVSSEAPQQQPHWPDQYELSVGWRAAAMHLAMYAVVMAGLVLMRISQPGMVNVPTRTAAYIAVAAVLAGALWFCRNQWENIRPGLRAHLLASLAALAALTVLSEVIAEAAPSSGFIISSIILAGTLALIRAPAAAAAFVVLVGAGWLLLTGTAGWPAMCLVAITGAIVHRLSSRQAAPFRRSAGRTQQLEARALAAEAVIKSFEDSGNTWLWRVGADGRLTYASPGFAHILEQDVSELIGRDLLSVLRERVQSTEQRSAFQTLEFYMAARLQFKDLVLTVNVNENEHWFSMAGVALTDDRGQHLGYSGLGTDLTAAEQEQDNARQLVLFDGLTGLANRTHFRSILDDLLARSFRTNGHCTLMYIDLDRFKIVNDTLGHPVGDELLREVARRIDRVVRGKGQAARLGGDEFVAVLADGPSAALSSSIASQIIDELSAPFHIAGSHIQIGASVGLATAPSDGATSEDLLRHADLALYAAKKEGRGTYRVYDKAMGVTAEFRRSLEVDLGFALREGQLRLLYQPFMDLEKNTLAGFEALLRWNHPKRGEIAPEQFISVAEESGLITRVGEWALRTALREAADWPEHISIAVNLSPLQLQDVGFSTLVMNALAESQIHPGRVEFEVTEGVFLQETQAIKQNFDQLKRMGLRLALDDFGTGYSSLGYLQKAEFNKIKIDRSFVAGIQDQSSGNFSIVRAVVALAHSLGMSTTAEGAETLEQVDMLRRIGCSHVQGFAYGGPMNYEEACSVVFKPSTANLDAVLHPRNSRIGMLRKVTIKTPETECAGILRNVSSGGAMLEVEVPLQLGSAVDLLLKPKCCVSGTVQWTSHKRIGVMFDQQIVIEEISR
jgi:diguanylate cyclase (GGDEF)-like protein